MQLRDLIGALVLGTILAAALVSFSRRELFFALIIGTIAAVVLVAAAVIVITLAGAGINLNSP